MRILQVIPYFCFGGAEIMCENLCYALRDQGHEVLAVSLYNDRTPIAQRMKTAGITIEYLDKKLGLDISMVSKLMKIMKRFRPDVVHTHLDVIKYAAAAAKLAGVKKCVHTVHSVAHKEAEGRAQKYINKTYYKLGWSVPVALSDEIQQTIADFYGMDKEKIPVIRNGIDLTRCVPKTDFAFGETVTFLHVGRFDVPKNHAGLLKLFARLHEKYPQCRLQLVGDGDLRPEMETLAEDLGITPWVEFCGMQSDVHPYLHKADLFILPSLYEGNPMTIIEAMGTALPIIATDVGGIPDMLTNGETALLVPCKEEALLHSCETLLQDEALRRRLGQNAKQESPRFSSGYMAQCYCEHYQ